MKVSGEGSSDPAFLSPISEEKRDNIILMMEHQNKELEKKRLFVLKTFKVLEDDAKKLVIAQNSTVRDAMFLDSDDFIIISDAVLNLGREYKKTMEKITEIVSSVQSEIARFDDINRQVFTSLEKRARDIKAEKAAESTTEAKRTVSVSSGVSASSGALAPTSASLAIIQNIASVDEQNPVSAWGPSFMRNNNKGKTFEKLKHDLFDKDNPIAGQKTKMCMWHLHKTCIKGLECTFAHDEQEMETWKKKWESPKACHYQ